MTANVHGFLLRWSPIAIGAVLLQPRNCRWACPDEGRDKDRKLRIYLPAASLRSFGEARPAGRFKGEARITANNAVLLVEF